MNINKNEINQGKSKQIKYFFLYSKSMVRKEVSRNTFIQVEGKCLVSGDAKYKIIGGCTKTIAKLVRRFKAESLLDSIFGAVDGLKILFNALNKISELKKDADNYLSKQSLLLLSNILLSVKSLSDSPSIISFIKIVVELYTFKEMVYEKESLDGLLMAGLSLLLPNKINDLIKRATTFTNVKFLDDIGLYHNLVVWLSDIFSCIFDCVKSKLPTRIVALFDSFIGKINVAKHHMILDNGKKLVDKYKRDPKVMSNEMFRHEVLEFVKSAEDDPDFFSWARRHAGVGYIFEAVLRMGKVAKSYGEMSRVEPTCFIFEGPPGTLKSYTMLPLIKSLGMAAYSHVVKSVDDGKDFYDSYNNEPIFYMDDVGQQGVSQWRTIINMVSPVKLPLDCADAKLKDTKFFNSELIFLTTNCFSNLHGLTKSDCIADVKALWRRGNVFDFSQVKNNKGSLLGSICYKRFDIPSGSFVSEFPVDVNNFFREKGLDMNTKFVITDKTERVELLVWMKKIVQAFQAVKKSFYSSTDLSDIEKEALNFDLLAESDLSEVFEDAFEDERVARNIHVLNDSSKRSLLISGLTNRDDVYLRQMDDQDSYLLMIRGEEQANYVFSNITSNFCDLSLSDIYQIIKGYLLYIKDTFWTSFSAIFSWLFDPKGGLECTIYLSIYIVIMAFLFMYTLFYPTTLEQESNVVSFVDKEIHSGVLFVHKNVKHCEIFGNLQDKEANITKCLVSGRKIILPNHAVLSEEVYIKIYSNGQKRNILVDLEKCKILYRNAEEDLCVLSLPETFPSPFKSLKNFLKFGRSPVRFWLSDEKVLDYGKISVPYKGSITYYTTIPGLERKLQKAITIPEQDRVLYNERGTGLCGSVVVDEQGFLQGIHVAGQEKLSTGCARLWSEELKLVLSKLLVEDISLVPFEISQREVDGSFIKLESNIQSSVPSKTNFGPSPLYGIFPIHRSPANLTHTGRCTVKDVAKKSLMPCEPVISDELCYARKVCAGLLTEFDILSDFEVVKGNQLLAGLNKDSSNGFGCEKEKSVYIDFVNGKFTDSFANELSHFEENVNAGVVDWDKLIWIETLKDELRGVEKNGEPRSFRVGTIYNQVLTKKYFGKLVEHIVANREKNQIMIGCNPFKDWDDIYQVLVSSAGVFAGDVKKWDGKMSPQVQREVQELIVSLMPQAYRKIGNVLIEATFRSLVSIQDDLILTTHSMASGSFLTAILNSFVHRFYTAMWFYRYWLIAYKRAPTVLDFGRNIVDYLYGDDSVNAIKNRDIEQSHNALTMRDFYRSLGMDLTTSSKGVIEEPFDRIEDITFLKRRFVYHPKLQRIMCPLELTVLQSGLSWIDYSKDISMVLKDKLHNYQREIYLHSDWEFLLKDFIERMKSFGVQFSILPESYLFDLYNNNVDALSNFYQLNYF